MEIQKAWAPAPCYLLLVTCYLLLENRFVRALLVEDDATIAEFVERGLREAGFAMDRAADGEAGLELALAAPYDVAIVDVMLPKRDGLSLIDELRKRAIATPVLILSAKR